MDDLQQQTAPRGLDGFLERLLTEPLFWDLDLVDFAVLAAIGLAWSALIWAVTEGVKARKQWVKPYTLWQFRALAWGPILTSSCLALAAFPAAVAGVGSQTIPPYWLSFLMGAVGGFGAKVAHDWFRSFAEAVRSRLLNVIRGAGGPDAP